MALVTTTFFTTVLPFFFVSAAFPVRFCFFIVTMSPQSCIIKEKPFYQLFIESRAENIYLAPQKNGIKR